MICILCGSDALEEIPGFSGLARITSDSRSWHAGGTLAACPHCQTVQKPVDDAFKKDAETIYAQYHAYFQSGGKEQKIFTGAAGIPRSELLLRHVLSLQSFPEHCTLLDIGCGSGNLLSTLSLQQPGWQLFGADLNERHRERILTIRGVKDFFTGDAASIRRRFDLIFLSHVLEHIYAPAEFLQKLLGLLNPGGRLVILVPDWMHNFFDLLVADHCIHFTPPALRWLLAESGYRVLSESSSILPKEICLLAGKAEAARETVAMPHNPVTPILDKAIRWLTHTRDWAMDIRKQEPHIGILGTAIAATWLAHAAKLEPEFFVDEDEDRQGLTYLGRPVKSPASLSGSARVLVPLPPGMAEQVAARLNKACAEPVFLAPPAAA
jgi:SAM-dependent methyltransferase